MIPIKDQVNILLSLFYDQAERHIDTIINARPEITDPEVIFAAILKQALYETTHNIPSKHQSIIDAFLCL